MHHAFLYISLPSLHDDDDETSEDEFIFLSLNLSVLLKKSTPGKFAYICHFQQIGINETKFEKIGIHFKSDVIVAVAVVDFKVPY